MVLMVPIYLCKVSSELPFSTLAVILSFELSKLVISLVFFLIQDQKTLKTSLLWHLAAPYALPAVLYGANNIGLYSAFYGSLKC
ncbi:hypothetical protein XELAEV_18016997mg [Xenopus laevis]|uniref:Uncharacterized protein n=1 Tax=Xenopus laevis TaxID=8355 RepID=A0A974HSJ3_XENLA|nr:hypothetical protein XELAEV_18016997mg [Xenopus laevis]